MNNVMDIERVWGCGKRRCNSILSSNVILCNLFWRGLTAMAPEDSYKHIIEIPIKTRPGSCDLIWSCSVDVNSE